MVDLKLGGTNVLVVIHSDFANGCLRDAWRRASSCTSRREPSQSRKMKAVN
jgi:hypothetical protein